MQKICWVALWVTIALRLSAQTDFNHYKPLFCSGTIPEEFITPSTKKYKSDLKKIDEKKYKKGKEKKDRKRFALESNFVIDDMLQSGRVLFNDPISKYLNEVAAILVKAEPGLKKPIRVYVLRSSGVNAFATERGAIFVTLGLLSQLENEAQLAYILSHEITHVMEGHTLDMFLEAKEIERRASRNTVMTEAAFDDNLMAKNRYSKELESEADEKGLARLLKTEYGVGTLNTVFDVLKYAYLPFDDVFFDRSFFETASFTFPNEYWEGETKAIAGPDEYQNDDKSTHPNIGARREALFKALQGAKPAGDKQFILPESRFVEARKMARFELPALYLMRDHHEQAIYTAYLLLQTENSVYLKTCIAKALYLRAKLLNDSDYSKESETEEIEGQSQRLYRFLDKLNARETTIFALRYAWILLQEHPDNPDLKRLIEDLFRELGKHSKSVGDFLQEKPVSNQVVLDSLPAAAETDNKERSKYDKINEQKGITKAEEQPGLYWKTAFAGFLDQADFKAAFQKGQSDYAKRQEREEYYNSAKGRSQYRKDRKKEENHGVGLGINKVMVVNPFYLKLDARKENAVQYIQTEYGHENLNALIETAAEKSGLKVGFLDVEDLKNNQVDRFNDIRLLNDWFSEQLRHDNLSLTPGVNQSDINAIAEKYGTDYFLWTGVISLREKKDNLGLMIAIGVIYPPILPFAIASAVKPDYDMFQYAVLYDVRTGRSQSLKFEYFDKRDSDALVKAHLYDVFWQIKRK